MKDFAPHTRQQDEREITVVQKDFSAGVYNDIPATKVPANGVCYLENFVNKGSELVGRSGSRKWGNYATGTSHASLPLKYTNITYTSVISGSNRLNTITSGYTTSNTDEGNVFIHPSGLCEEILTSTGNVVTTKIIDSTISIGTGSASIRGKVNGMYYHSGKKKIILILDTTVYVSADIEMSSWIKAYCQSYTSLSNSICTIDEKDNYIIIGNIVGIFKLNLDIDNMEPYYYFRINSDVPENLNLSYGTNPTFPYIRRYIYSLTKMNASTLDSDRTTNGSSIIIESGTNKTNTSGVDYSIMRTNYPINDSTFSLISGLTLPNVDESTEKDRHWDYFSIWGTTDCGVNGTDAVIGTATNTEQYIWINDIPIMKPLRINVSGSNATVLDGSVTKYDVGSSITFKVGSGRTTSTILTVNENNGTFVMSGSSTQSGVLAMIGASKFASVTYNTSTHVFTLAEGDTISSSDVGKRIFLSNNSKIYISEYLSSTTFKSCDNPTITGTVYACWEPSSRSYCDWISDDTLRNRIAGYPCYQRFFDKLPNADILCYSTGFLFTALRDDNYVFYSQVPDGFEYLMGYYHPAYQLTHIKDGIRAIKAMTDKIVVYGYNTTSTIPTNTYSNVTYDELGVYISVISSLIVNDDNIGCVAHGSIQQIENGKHILITSEPALRIFNGTSYSDNLASQKMMTKIRALHNDIISIYSSLTGYIFWGLDE